MHVVRFVQGAKVLLAVVLAVFGIAEYGSAQGSNLPPQRGDLVIEAGGYLKQSESDLECSPESSKTWAEKALRTLDGVKEKDQTTREMVANARSDGKTRLEAAESRIGQFNETGNQAQALIKQAKLETSQESLKQIDAKECYAGFSNLRSRIAQRRESASDDIRLGDALVSTNRKSALAHYRKALKIDAEYPGLDEKISDAANSKHRRR